MNTDTVYSHPAGTENPPSSFLLDRDRDNVYFRIIPVHQVTNVLQNAHNDARSPRSKA